MTNTRKGVLLLVTRVVIVLGTLGIVYLVDGNKTNRCDNLWDTFHNTGVTKKVGYDAFFNFMANHCYEIKEYTGKIVDKEYK